MEIWKYVVGYEGLYMVSNLGNIKSLNYNNTGKERILKPSKNKGGYLMVKLYKEGKQKTCKIHRLVASTFIENPYNLPQVNHKDENKTNNSIDNLEFCDAKYNCNYGTGSKRSALNRINHPTISKKVLCVETGVAYSSAHQAARQTGIYQSNISSCCIGHRKTAGKLHWQFA